ncbi:MAG: hypothetical protein IKR04_01240 [Clostridia bacterium]|nr:hypothetical protein [Clostridia bacterium]
MAGTLDLSLNNVKNNSLENTSKNIISSIGDAFKNAVTKGTEKLSFPEGMEKTVKEGLEKIDLKEIGGKAAETALKSGMQALGMKSSLFSSVKGVFKAIQEGDLKNGLSNGLNAAIDLVKIPTVAKTILKQGKDMILEQTMGDELKNVMKAQQNTVSRINRKCNQMEEAFKNNDDKTLDRVYKSLKTDMEKVMPIQNVLNKGNDIMNRYELYKNRGTTQVTQVESELLKKLA